MLVVSADKTGLFGEPLVCPIVSMFDADGDLTSITEEVCTAIIMLPNNEPMVVYCHPRNIVEMKLN